MTERVTTQEIEDGIVDAVTSIRRDWPRMEIAGGASGQVRSADPVTALDRWVSLRYDVTIILNGWCRVIVEDRPVTKATPLGSDIAGMCDFLARHAQWFSGHEAAQDALDELVERARLVHAVAHPTRRDWMPIGHCPLEVERPDDEGGVLRIAACGGQVRAYPDTDRDPTCQECGTEAVVAWWERHMFPDAELRDLLTTEELVTWLHKTQGLVVRPSTIRQWLVRGTIVPSGVDEKGRRVYSREAVVYALDRRERVGS